MFIEPVENKTTNKPKEYTLHEDKIQNMKTYVDSNVQKFGEGPEAWRSTTLLAKHEMFGPNAINSNDDTVEFAPQDETEPTVSTPTVSTPT